MRQKSHILNIATRGRRLHDITDEIVTFLADSAVKTGVLTIFCRHTSASLVIQENADPDVRADLEAFFDRVTPEAPGRYRHDTEGPEPSAPGPGCPDQVGA
jgi:secondary thiamine-phosphate synthase enzyme